jgi:hypothetical protein
MHGTNIHGQHYVQLDWTYDWDPKKDATVPSQSFNLLRDGKTTVSQSMRHNSSLRVVVKRVVLDWEAAYSDNYDIQIWNETTKIWVSIFTMRPTNAKQRPPPQVRNSTIEFGRFNTTGGIVTAKEWGQSPGVTFPTPLHVVHDIALDDNHIGSSNQFDKEVVSSKMRLLIHTSATGWGVSLWQIQVYGYHIQPQI